MSTEIEWMNTQIEKLYSKWVHKWAKEQTNKWEHSQKSKCMQK